MEKSEMGLYNYVISAVAILLTFLDAGLSTLIVTRATDKRLKILFHIFVFSKLILIILIMPSVLFAFNLIFGFQGQIANYVLLLVVLSISWDLSTFFSITHRCHFDYFGEAVAKVLWSVIFIILIFVLWFLKVEMTVTVVILAQVSGFLISTIWSLQRLLAAGVKIFKFDLRILSHTRLLFSISIPMAASMVVASVFNSIDQIILGYYEEFEFLASFGLAQRVCLFMYMPITVAQAFLLPYVANNHRKLTYSSDNLIKMRSVYILGLLSALSLAQICILSVDYILVPAIGQTEYEEISWICRLVILYLPPAAMHAMLWVILISMRFTVLANIPATLIVPFICIFDYIAIKFFSHEYIIYSPFIAHFVLFLGLAIVFFVKVGFDTIIYEMSLGIIIVTFGIYSLNWLNQLNGTFFEILSVLLMIISLVLAYKYFRTAKLSIL